MSIGQHVRRAEEQKTAARMAASIAAEASEKSPEDIDAEDAQDVAAMATPATGMPLTFEQMLALFKAAGANQMSPEAIAQIATTAAAAGAERIKPKELTISQTERKSAYNPLGEKNHPRPKLKCHMYFGSAPLGSPKEVTTLTMDEILALNALTPGHYRITKMDRSTRIIEVRGQMNSNLELDRLWILLPSGDDQQNLYPPLAELVQQCNDDNRTTPSVAA